jgi:hypothetical protein
MDGDGRSGGDAALLPLFPLAPTPRLQGGFIKNFMETVVPLIRDKSLLISSEGVMAMTQHMCEKGNGSAAVTWLLTCRGTGSTIDDRLVPLTRGRFSRA